ncbi:Ferrochelatase [Porphyridium purpureum]|uniref:Ferrochelatase n=1 Tax=Porphyridium purpureum TaxID=35688 RepID=A0A5J4YTC3_PORPP|nr:Ferrochelatase [Porphyridium purpureum]|eukprot:POR9006..scf236_6
MIGFVGGLGVAVPTGTASRQDGALRVRQRCVPLARQTRRAAVRMTAVAPSQTPATAEPGRSAGVKKLGVLLLNLGGPERPEDVQGFLYNLFSDPDIIRLPRLLSPLQSFLANEIARSRAPKSRAAYESIGGGSPIVRITNQQASALEDELLARGYSAKVFVGMRYWHPFTEEAVEEIKAYGPDRLVILPLYPQYSISTSGSSLRVLDRLFKKEKEAFSPLKIDHTVVPEWYQRPGYVHAQAKLIKEQLATLTDEEKKSTKVMFSAHGVPESYIEAGDPYQQQIEECCKLIMQEVEDTDWTLSYQSRVGPVQWLQPYTDVVLEELGKEGLQNLVVVPISFVSEHIETLEEIDIEYRELAHESGIKKFLRVPALDCNPDFVKDLADMSLEALEKPSLRVGEAMNLSIKGDAQDPADMPDVDIAFGFNNSAETLNGRLAMLALAALTSANFVSGQGMNMFSNLLH